MTPGQAETLFARVAAEAGDPEVAHLVADELHVAVLQAIADGAVGPDVARELARIALRTEHLNVPRRCA